MCVCIDDLYHIHYLLLQLKYEKINSLLITLTNHGQDIKQINYVCLGYTVHIPPWLLGYALELRVVYERYHGQP